MASISYDSNTAAKPEMSGVPKAYKDDMEAPRCQSIKGDARR